MDANGNNTIDPEVKASVLSQYFQSQFTTDNYILPDNYAAPRQIKLVFRLSPAMVHQLANHYKYSEVLCPPSWLY